MPRIAKTPRQPNRSPITPAIEAPSTLAVSAMPRSRAIATWRWFIGTRSPSSAIATGNTPPATSPATIRMATSSVKFVATAQMSAAIAITSTQAFISRVLPKKSPVTPSTGWISA